MSSAHGPTAASTGLLARRWSLVRAAVSIAIALVVVAAALLHPWVAERLLSSDGELAPASKRLLVIAQLALATTAALLLVVAHRFRRHTPANERLVLGALFGVVSIGASVFVCEVGLRAASGFRPLPADRHFFFLHDRLLGWRHRPGAVARFKDAVVRINSAGLRDDELPSRRAPGEWRVLFLGDSQVFGDGVAADDTFVQQLEGAFDRLQAINAGVIGYGTDQQVLYFEQGAAHYDLDAVVVGLNAYDLRDNVSEMVRSGYLKPRFELADGGLTLTNVPVSPGSIVDRTQRVLRTRSHLYTLINQTTGSRRERSEDGGGRGREPFAEVFPSDREMPRALDVTSALLARLASGVRARGARLAVAFLPYEMDFTGDSRYAGRTDRLVHMLETAGRHAGFAVWDLRPHLRSGRELYLDTMHFSPEGHRRAAAALKDLLAREGFIPAAHAKSIAF